MNAAGFHSSKSAWAINVILVLIYSLPILCCAGEPQGTGTIVNDDFLQKNLNLPAKPRLMTPRDVKKKEELRILSGDYSLYTKCAFVIQGDFNKDGRKDHAVVGMYEGPFPGRSIFVAIFSETGKGTNVDFLHTLPVAHDRAFLCLTRPGQKQAPGIDKKYDMISVIFEVDSDNGFDIVWDGTKYGRTEEARWVNPGTGMP